MAPAESGESRIIFPNFQNCACAKSIRMTINAIASICRYMLGYLSLNIIYVPQEMTSGNLRGSWAQSRTVIKHRRHFE